jgi:hypothetical protein
MAIAGESWASVWAMDNERSYITLCRTVCNGTVIQAGYLYCNLVRHVQMLPVHTHTHARTHARARTHTHTHTHTHTDIPYWNRENPLPDYRASADIKRNKYTHARTHAHFTACFSPRFRLPLLKLIGRTKERLQISCHTFGNNDGTHKYALRLCACI